MGKKYIYYFFIFLIFSQCANMVAPSGGAKDTKNPKMVTSAPTNKITNFQGEKIELTFDEWIKTDNLKKELLITPALKKDYEYSENKNKLIITFKAPLEENTTYTFNFRKGIKDITESNIANSDSTRLVFSTGPVIDSLLISGVIKDLETDKAIENAVVALYKADDTLEVTTDPPYYFTKTDNLGKFKLQNLKQGIYKLYAFTDKADNSIYNEVQDKIGFLKENIDLNKNLDSLALKLVSEDNTPPKISKARASVANNFYLIEFSEGLKKLQIDSATTKIAYFLSPNGKELKIYNPENKYDSIPLSIIGEDSTGNIFRSKRKIIFNNEKQVKEKLTVAVEPKVGEKINKNLKISFVFNKPMQQVDLLKIKYLLDKDTLNPKPFIEKEQEGTWNTFKNKYTLEKLIKAQEKITIIVDSSAFMSIENDPTPALNLIYTVRPDETFGTIKGKTNTQEPNYIIQLLNDKYEVLKEVINQPLFEFKYLEAGTYYLRAVIDKNGNGKWDRSNLKMQTFAEKLIYYKESFKVRENWDMEGIEFSF